MPVYEYKCRRCGHKFEALQRLGENGENLKCPHCGESKPEKVFSTCASSQTGAGGYAAPTNSCNSGFG